MKKGKVLDNNYLFVQFKKNSVHKFFLLNTSFVLYSIYFQKHSTSFLINLLNMKKISFAIIIAQLLVFASCNSSEETEKPKLTSPDKKIILEVNKAENNGLTYTIKYNDSIVLKPSVLGLILEDTDFTTNLSISSVSEITQVEDKYEMPHGKRKSCIYSGNEQTFHIENKDGKKMDIIFRVSDEGVAFRYFLPNTNGDLRKVTQENTTFQFDESTRAWLQPMAKAQTGWANTNPSYEEQYQMDIPANTPSPTEAGWIYPALFKQNETWLLITEAGMDGNYCATRLSPTSPNYQYTVTFPQEPEVYTDGALKPQSKKDFYSPWRIIAIGDLANIVNSSLGTDFAAPSTETNNSFVKPGQASWSWGMLKDGSILYDIQKEFIDLAADMNYEYCLVDVNWDTRIGYEKIKELVDYAAPKNVGVLLWYNSSGDWNETNYTPKSKLLTHESRIEEFRKISELGIKGVKIDFFAGDGKSIIQYYIDILNDALETNLLVNFHGCTLPRGLHRTYPNLMTMESIKGFEFITFGQETADLAASHCAMLPFTRNAFDPMDFTPMCFTEIPGIERKTSNAFELALPVLFLSGIQHLVETPKGMETVPEYVKEFISNLPNQWDDTQYIDGFPGKYVVIARKAGNNWYIAGINGEEKEKEINLDLSAFGKVGILITDGDDNRSFKNTEINLTDDQTLPITLNGNGGFIIKI